MKIKPITQTIILITGIVLLITIHLKNNQLINSYGHQWITSEDGVSYFIDHGEATAERYDGDSSTITIPSEIAGCPVKRIGTEFMGREKKTTLTGGDMGTQSPVKKTNIVSIVISEGVREIGANAFQNQTELQTVSLPDSLRWIGAGAFENCKKLENINFPKELLSIKSDAFRNCTSLKRVSFGEYLGNVGESAFAGCSALEKLEFSGSISEISSGAFMDCMNLAEIKMPLKVLDINANAFQNTRWYSEQLEQKKPVIFANALLAYGGEEETFYTPQMVRQIAEEAYLPNVKNLILSGEIRGISVADLKNAEKLRTLQVSEGVKYLDLTNPLYLEEIVFKGSGHIVLNSPEDPNHIVLRAESNSWLHTYADLHGFEFQELER